MDIEMMEVNVSCCLCNKDYKTEIALPEGWKTRYESTDVEDGFCPEHASIASFCDDQCPGCVGGWGDCDLWRSFAFRGRHSLTEADHQALCNGYCPKRTNGTVGVSDGVIEDIDLSTPAKHGGMQLSQAIREYVETYGTAA